MHREMQGYYVTSSTAGEQVNAFVPAMLPPRPPIDWSAALRNKFDQALVALGRLDIVSNLLPDTSLFLHTYVRKEAVLSSMIEGTQSSISELLLYELDQEPGVPIDDVREVSNYVAALEYGIRSLHEGMPLSLRLLKEIHRMLLSRGRRQNQTPGEFRRSQNWIGGSRPGNAACVPPPPHLVNECMGALELFLHDDPEPTSVLLKAALSHVQFETIHPFLDGNGRLGRLLVALLLCEQQVLRQPMLPLSLYFKTHRRYYYDLLNRVRTAGDWEAWLEFFADAVIAAAGQAVEATKRLLDLAKQDRDRIRTIGRAATSVLRIHRAFMARPIATSNRLVDETGITAATVNKSLRRLEDLGIIREITDRKRDRVFCYTGYIDIMNQGTELPDT